MKFEEAFSTYDSCLHSIEEIANLYSSNPKKFKVNYNLSFVCPECHIAKLSFNNATTPYFKSYPHAIHADNCELKQNEMSWSVAEKFSDNPDNATLIRRQMNSILNSLLKTNPLSSVALAPKDNTKMSKCTKTIVATTTTKRLPRKRIDLPMNDEDYNRIKYFYGRVSLNWEKDEKNKRYKILLWHREKGKLLCKISVSYTLYGYIPTDFKYPKNYNCNIVFMGTIEKLEGKSYCQGHIRFADRLIVCKDNS